MIASNLTILDPENKYPELLPLYLKWHDRTMFLSTGNTAVPEWKALKEYCIAHKDETAHFFFDLIDVYQQEVDQGIRADNFVGFFNDIIAWCFDDDPEYPHFNGFVGGPAVQQANQGYLLWYLRGKPEGSYRKFTSWIKKLTGNNE